ncbi:MAG: peptidoglycan-binding domain-containing protein, partial [Ilumatobacteraceae bacterium]
MNDLNDRSRSIATLLGHEAAGIAVRDGSLEQVRRRARQRRQRRLAGVGAFGAAAALSGVARLSTLDGARTVGPAGATPVSTDTADDNSSSSADATSVGSTDVTTIPSQPDAATVGAGSTGVDVARVQDRLRELGFDPGPSDGVFGTQTEQAVWAFEGLVMNRAWSQQSGSLDERSMLELFNPALVIAPRRSGIPSHTEVYLDLQVLVVFHGDTPALITHISSGSGETWCALVTLDTDDNGDPLPEPVTKDVCAVSKTPGGVFHFYRTAAGNVQSSLGGMYNPMYFNYSIALTSAQSVPREPGRAIGVAGRRGQLGDQDSGGPRCGDGFRRSRTELVCCPGEELG